MCKFNNRLFVFTIICLWVCVLATPIQESQKNSNDELSELMAITALLAPQDNYDLHYDQRQKGEENYRVKLDGIFIGIPQEETSALLLLTDDIFENIGEYGTSSGKTLHSAGPASSQTSAKRLTPSSTLDSNQQISQSSHNTQNFQNTLNKLDDAIVEIPAAKKQPEARHSADINETEELPSKSGSKTKAYISSLLNFLKRGRKY